MRRIVSKINLLDTVLQDQLVHVHRKTNEMFRVALRKKGFSFKNNTDLLDFFASNVYAEMTRNTTIFYVNGVPFLEHHKADNPSVVQENVGENEVFSLDIGYFKYL